MADTRFPNSPAVAVRLCVADGTSHESLRGCLVRIGQLQKLRRLEFSGFAFGDDDLQKLPEIPSLTTLQLLQTSISEEGRKRLEAFPNLRELRLVYCSGVGDKSTVHCCLLMKLEKLDLPHTKISDTGLSEVKRMTELRSLILTGTLVGDKGLEHLQALTKLNSFEAGVTVISDRGLEHLKRLPKLRSVSLWNTDVTSKRIEAFRKAQPQVDISN
jgi:hypothetical protein